MNRKKDIDVKKNDDAFDEEHWLNLARKGEESGWAELHKHYYHKLWRTVNQIVKDEKVAEDLVQESFMKAYRTLNKFRGQSTFSTWIYRISVNQALDYLRKHNRRRKYLGLFPVKEDEDSLEHELVDTHTGFDAATGGETMQTIKKAFEQLPEDQRTVVELRLVQGFSTEETAKIIGCARGTVLSRLYYACQKLKKVLKGVRDELK
ncbi:MAG: sigma-70 family RNA polymerase sigma factor [Verrucomicrobiota bacterium]